MHILLAALILIVTPVMTSAQWQKGNEKIEDTSDRKSVNGFGGHLIIVKDPQGFIKEWSKPETPNIKPISDVRRGELIGAFVLFVGCKPDSAGVCNSEVDYVVLKPDGTV